jgi:hypothetical protein
LIIILKNPLQKGSTEGRSSSLMNLAASGEMHFRLCGSTEQKNNEVCPKKIPPCMEGRLKLGAMLKASRIVTKLYNCGHQHLTWCLTLLTGCR